MPNNNARLGCIFWIIVSVIVWIVIGTIILAFARTIVENNA